MTLHDQLDTFARCVWEPDDIINLRLLNRNSGKVLQEWYAGDMPVKWLALQNRTMDCYAGINPRTRMGGAGNADVSLARCLFCDFDDISLEEAARRIDYAGLPVPTLVVWSGGGVHCYWRLSDEIRDLAAWSRLQRRLIKLLRSDKAIHDPARIMRLPGLFNHKPGRSAAVIILACAHRVFELGRLTRLLPADLEYQASRLSKRRIQFEHIVDPYSIDIEPVLLAHGWKISHKSAGSVYWTRPGKEHGISAVSGPRVAGGIGSKFYVWTSSAPPFQAGKTYSTFAVVALLDYRGSFKETWRHIACRV